MLDIKGERSRLQQAVEVAKTSHVDARSSKSIF